VYINCVNTSNFCILLLFP